MIILSDVKAGIGMNNIKYIIIKTNPADNSKNNVLTPFLFIIVITPSQD